MPVEGRLGPQDLDSDVEFTESNPNTEHIYKVYINELSKNEHIIYNFGISDYSTFAIFISIMAICFSKICMDKK